MLDAGWVPPWSWSSFKCLSIPANDSIMLSASDVAVICDLFKVLASDGQSFQSGKEDSQTFGIKRSSLNGMSIDSTCFSPFCGNKSWEMSLMTLCMLEPNTWIDERVQYSPLSFRSWPVIVTLRYLTIWCDDTTSYYSNEDSEAPCCVTKRCKPLCLLYSGERDPRKIHF